MDEEIPLDSENANYDFDVELAGKLYKFFVNWNDRGSFWVIQIYDSKEKLLAQAVPQTNYPLFLSSTNPNLPAGELWILDTTGKNQEITRNNLGKEILLVFRPL